MEKKNITPNKVVKTNENINELFINDIISIANEEESFNVSKLLVFIPYINIKMVEINCMKKLITKYATIEPKTLYLLDRCPIEIET